MMKSISRVSHTRKETHKWKVSSYLAKLAKGRRNRKGKEKHLLLNM
jgi:hypothetical protein